MLGGYIIYGSSEKPFNHLVQRTAFVSMQRQRRQPPYIAATSERGSLIGQFLVSSERGSLIGQFLVCPAMSQPICRDQVGALIRPNWRLQYYLAS